MLKFKNYRFKEKFLLNYLSPTSKGTKWYESPPSNMLNPRLVGRYVLQFHQFAEIISDLIKSKEIKKIKFLDLGTGNGILPELVSMFYNCELSHGLDPYGESEHKTFPRSGNRKRLLEEILKIFKKNTLEISNYKNLIKNEGYFKNPRTIKFKKKKANWVFLKKFIHELPVTKKYNLIFAKCIDHIPDWKKLIKDISLRSDKNSYFIIKHNSFFSYNGAHRYASTFIPWGHLVLSEKDYKEYANKFHKNRSKDMIDFYYKGLSYPRYSIDDLMNILLSNNWEIKSIEHSVNKNFRQQLKLAGGFKKLTKEVNKNFKNVSLQELSTSRSMIIAKKIK